ncbi:ABC transporter substrate-binding protein [Cohnella sp. GCM10020058]|uniref:ABC transporter substrate-binding protein n=1 Tax=Cohnella sp. GCM10020058 TaxID=3317330 RepID=UPI003640A5A6
MEGRKIMKRMKSRAWMGVVPLLLLSMLASACSGNNSGTASPTASTTSKPSESAATTSATTATTAATETAIDTSEPVKLKLVLLGAKPADMDEVYAEVNKILKKKINAELEVRFLDWNEYGEKYPLLFAANEDFDMIYTADWAFYNQTASKDGFLALTEDMLKKYAPNTWEKENPIGWDQAKVNGNIYMVPHDSFVVGETVALIRGDLREKYNLPEVKSQSDLANYLTTIAKNEKGMTAFSGPGTNLSGTGLPIFFSDMEMRFVNGSVPLVYDMNSEHPTLTNYLENPKTLEKLNMFYDMAQQGVWSKDAIVSKTDWRAAFKEGKTAADMHNVTTMAASMDSILRTHPEWKPELIDVNPTVHRFQSALISNGIGIHATSKNPERALMAIDLLRYDQELFDLTNYGIKGKHWEPVGDNKYKSLPASTGYPPEGACPWGWKTPLARQLEGVAGDKITEVYDKWKAENIIHSPFETFALDDTNIKNELAALKNVQQTYLLPIYFGLVEPAKGLPEVMEKLKQAGMEKVRVEMQKQMDAFIEAKNKEAN